MKIETILRAAFLLIGSLVAIMSFIYGLLCLFFQERVRRIKAQLRHYDRKHKARKEIREFGIQLITLSAILGSLIYTGLGYDVSRREFNARNRPFLKSEPLFFDGGSYYELSERDRGVQIKFKFKILNVGSVPAYDVIITKTLRSGDKLAKGLVGPREEQVIFPGDNRWVDFGFIASHESMSTEDLTKKIQDSEILLGLRLDYRGLEKDSKRLHYTEYEIRFPNANRHDLVTVKADIPQ